MTFEKSQLGGKVRKVIVVNNRTNKFLLQPIPFKKSKNRGKLTFLVFLLALSARLVFWSPILSSRFVIWIGELLIKCRSRLTPQLGRG